MGIEDFEESIASGKGVPHDVHHIIPWLLGATARTYTGKLKHTCVISKANEKRCHSRKIPTTGKPLQCHVLSRKAMLENPWSSA